MAHPILTEKTTIEDMEIGDCIPCRYKAPVSGAVGEFSELGTCNAAEISKNGNVATPDGKFYFIKVDKGLLVADRVVQTDISWKTLNDAGLIDGALKKYGVVFDGTNTYGEVPYVAALAPTRVSVKVKVSKDDWATPVTTHETIISKFQSGGYGIQLLTDGTIRFQVYANGAYRVVNTPYTSLSPGEHIIYATFDGRYVRLYVDGVLQATTNLGGTYNITYAYNNSLTFGVDASASTGPDPSNPYYFSGKIYEVAIWNTSIDPTTVNDELTGNESGLVGWWKFEGLGGNKVYDKKGNNHITLYNHTWYIPPHRYTKGVYFNGKDSYGEIPYNSILQPQVLSIRVKVYKEDWSKPVSDIHTILSNFQTGGYGFQLRSTGNVGFQVYTNNEYIRADYPYTGLSPGEHVLLGIFDKNTIKLYIDGELKVSRSTSGQPITYSWQNSLVIGADAYRDRGIDPANPYLFSGSITELAIWNIAIDPLSINDELNGNETGLVGWWKFNENQGNVVYDHIGNNHITLHNTIWGYENRMKFRSLSGGNIYADENGNPTFRDSLYGAFPPNNEYDTYIKKSTLDGKITAGIDSIWNYGKCFSLTKGAPVIGTWVNRGGVSVTTLNTGRMLRGNDNRTDGSTWMDVAQVAFDGLGTNIGFRPVLEFIEPDSPQQNAYY